MKNNATHINNYLKFHDGVNALPEVNNIAFVYTHGLDGNEAKDSEFVTKMISDEACVVTPQIAELALKDAYDMLSYVETSVTHEEAKASPKYGNVKFLSWESIFTYFESQDFTFHFMYPFDFGYIDDEIESKYGDTEVVCVPCISDFYSCYEEYMKDYDGKHSNGYPLGCEELINMRHIAVYVVKKLLQMGKTVVASLAAGDPLESVYEFNYLGFETAELVVKNKMKLM